MSKDLLNADSAPTDFAPTSENSGVRLTKVPWLLAVFAFGGFILVMAMAVHHRAQSQHRAAMDKDEVDTGDATGQVADLVNKLPARIKPAAENPPAENAAPESSIASAPAPVAIDQDLLNFRRAKWQSFSNALAAPLKAAITPPANTSRDRREESPPDEMNLRQKERPLPVGGAAAAGLDRGATGKIIDLNSAPISRYLLRTGSVIPATLISGINSDLPGQILGQVRQDVFDTATGKHLLIPAGSRLVGEYSSEVQFGQNRVFAVWQRIVFPDGKALDLGAFPLSSGAGYAGAKDKVDNHYLRIFGSAILMSGVIAGVEYSQKDITSNSSGDTQSMSGTMSQALGQTLGQAMVEMLRKNMNISPTLIIRPGYRLNVMLVKDLEFTRAYQAFDYAAKLKN